MEPTVCTYITWEHVSSPEFVLVLNYNKQCSHYEANRISKLWALKKIYHTRVRTYTDPSGVGWSNFNTLSVMTLQVPHKEAITKEKDWDQIQIMTCLFFPPKTLYNNSWRRVNIIVKDYDVYIQHSSLILTQLCQTSTSWF